ncbi:hypothetical protein KC19_9G184400 [Ceratodon purpureus]|uniref:Uncharacterized protein n=1 Tax=Ceratodon purpureus TaxID=3225 RepID=A0A8T0GTD1_CERPU|nr:hypothetical protein KC19_9G184400 [Ceratodon purpureus]
MYGRLLDLVWKHLVVGRSQMLSTECNDLANCLNNIVRHFTLVNHGPAAGRNTTNSRLCQIQVRNCFSLESSSSLKL